VCIICTLLQDACSVTKKKSQKNHKQGFYVVQNHNHACVVSNQNSTKIHITHNYNQRTSLLSTRGDGGDDFGVVRQPGQWDHTRTKTHKFVRRSVLMPTLSGFLEVSR